jgi:hypothetical protein
MAKSKTQKFLVDAIKKKIQYVEQFVALKKELSTNPQTSIPGLWELIGKPDSEVKSISNFLTGLRKL